MLTVQERFDASSSLFDNCWWLSYACNTFVNMWILRLIFFVLATCQIPPRWSEATWTLFDHFCFHLFVLYVCETVPLPWWGVVLGFVGATRREGQFISATDDLLGDGNNVVWLNVLACWNFFGAIYLYGVLVPFYLLPIMLSTHQKNV